MSMITIYDTATAAPAVQTEPELVSSGNADTPAIWGARAVRTLERLALSAHGDARWTRPQLFDDVTKRLAPFTAGASNFAASWKILRVVDVRPTPAVGERLSADHDGGVPDLAAGTIVYTWTVEPIGDANAVAAAWSAAGLAARQRIEAAAELARLRFLTPGSGKAMTYRAKLAEWQRYGADQAPDPDAYPFAKAEAAARGVTIAALMAVWAVNVQAWAVQVGPAIEALEQAGKLAVDAAVAARDAAALATAEAITWPSPG